ncbi:MAG: adenine nucleotide alpha hydrolase [Chitinophagales bacterium]|nr:adenine nucleotide alpha hydrolase [Chitinophagales bacterium]
MNLKKKAVMHWSGGKDSALALQQILLSNEFEIVSLLTIIEEQTSLSTVHAIPIKILQMQAKSLNIPLYTIEVKKNLENYQQKMTEAVHYFKTKNVTHFIFGDLGSSNIKIYREKFFNPFGIEVVQPLWNKTSAEIINEFLHANIKAKIIVVDAKKFDNNFIGKELNKQTIQSFPLGIDVCGEFGEYHTLVYGGNLFKEEINFSITDIQKKIYKIQLTEDKQQIIENWQAQISV